MQEVTGERVVTQAPVTTQTAATVAVEITPPEGMAVMVGMVALNAQAMDMPVKMIVAVPGTMESLQQRIITASQSAANAPLYEISVSELSLAGRQNGGVVMRATEAELAKFNELGQRVVSGDGVGLIMVAGLLAIQMYGWHALQEWLHRKT